MATIVRGFLVTMCLLLLLAIAYLSPSLVVLNPPRASLPLWFALAAIVAGRSVLTLIAVAKSRPPAPLRLLVGAGACVLIGIAVWRVRDALTSSHFEDCNLLLGAMLMVQSALTFAACASDGNSVGTTRSGLQP